MGYSENRASKAPRNLRVILGGLIAWAAIFFGVVIATHRYHRAATMSETPTEMLWETLQNQGLPDNSFITFTNVQLSELDRQNAGDDDLAMNPVVVIPVGAHPNSARRLLVVEHHEEDVEKAKAQLEEFGTLTGHVTRLSGEEIVNGVYELIGMQRPEELKEYTDGSVLYTITPMREPLDKAYAEETFWLCGLAATCGLLLCCSGGPSTSSCFYFFLLAIVSLFGYPMRYGRGGKLVRILYAAIGVGLMGFGFKLMVMDGRFGNIDGNPILQALGFASGVIGLAAFLSVPCQLLTRKFTQSKKVRPSKKKQKDEKKMGKGKGKALAKETSSSVSETSVAKYQDGELVEPTSASSAEMQEVIDSLVPLGFDETLPLAWKDGDVIIDTAIQLGCQSMVVSDLEMVNGKIYTRLVSVLHDGLAVITVSRNSPVQADSFMGANGQYTAGRTNTAIELMSTHLENTAAVADQRGTTVVKIDSDETRDVCMFGRRVLADMRVENGEEELEIKPKKYGRFKYPAQRVIGELASV